MIGSLFAGVALFSIAALAHADGGTISFSGRVSDPVCAAGFVEADQQLRLDDCSRAVQGATVSVVSLDSGHTVALHTSSRVLERDVLMPPAQADIRQFSQHYNLATTQHPLHGSYLVAINYL